MGERMAKCAVGILVSALLLVAPASAAPVGTADVACAPGGAGGFAVISSNFRWAQTFTPTASGKLRYLEIRRIARAPGGSGGDIVVDVLSTTGGIPDGPPTPPLATTSIPAASINADNFFHDYSVTFPAASAAFLDQGTTYAYSLHTADTAQNAVETRSDTCPGTIYFSNGAAFSISGFTNGEDFRYATYLGAANDDFARARTLSGSSDSAGGTTAGGSREAGEPDHLNSGQPDANLWLGDNTAWYRWTAPASGPATVDVCTAVIDSILGIYTGSDLASLTRVVDDNNSCSSGFGSLANFNAVAGTTYWIAVGDAGGARENSFTISLTGNEAPQVTPLKPAPGSKIKSKRARIKAAVTDSATDLSPGDITSLKVDGVEASSFSYNSATDLLTHRTGRLAKGRHKIRVEATDGSQVAARKWNFKVKKRR